MTRDEKPDSVFAPHMDPCDIYLPMEVTGELMRCAANNGRISYEYLLAIYRKGKATRVIQLVDTLKKGSAQYHTDTNQIPWEHMGGTATNRKLSGTQTVAGWQGPYIESPLTSGMHPAAGTLHMYNTSVVNGNTGFDTDSDGNLDVTDNCCTLWLDNMTQGDAQAIDNAFDKGLSGNWYDGGRVKWNSTTRQCWVLVYW